MTDIDIFEEQRPRLVRLAYQMLGSVADAEDIAQETYLRWQRAGEPALDRPQAWFARTCTRLCLDRLKSAQRQREQYVGEWLPEPLADRPAPGDEVDDSVSMALLRTIERLRPAERAAFLLHDVFGYAFQDVASMLDRESADCRQLAVRARRKLAAEHHAAAEPPTAESVRRLADAFFEAVEQGDDAALRNVLAEDVVLYADGGGRVPAASRPIEGSEAVARFFVRVLAASGSIERRGVWFNGAPGQLVLEDGVPVSAFQFHVVDGRVAGVYVQRNPDKLKRLARADNASR